MKFPKALIAYILIIWPIIMIFLFTIITGKVSVSYHGFAIDHDSNIYLGKDSSIEVLDHNGKVLRSISSYTSRGYKFTITTDNQIKISTGDYLYITDLSGNLISKKRIVDFADDEQPRDSRYKFITSDGIEYIMENHYLRTHIYRLDKNRKTSVYKMPIFDYIVKLSATACFLSLIITVPIIILKYRRAIKR